MKKNEGIRLIVSFYWHEIRQYPRTVAAIVILVPIGIFFNGFAVTYIVSSVIDRFSTGGPVALQNIWHVFGLQIIGFLLSAIVGELIVWRLILWLVWQLEIKVSFGLYNRVFDFLTHQSSQFHANKFGGSLVSQTNKFVGTYVRFADTFTWNVLPFFSTLIFTLVILGIRIPWFAAGIAVITIMFIIISMRSYSKISHLNEVSSQADTKLSGQIADMISNILAVKSFSAEKRESRRFAGLNSTSAKASKNLLSATIKRDLGFAASLSSLLIIMFISILIGQAVAGITIGTMVLMLSYSMNLFNQLWSINGIARSFNRGYGDALPMAHILSEDILIKDPLQPKKSALSKGAISIHDLEFSYEDSDSDTTLKSATLFKDLNLSIPAGQRVGLVGRSGSGKTTITNLLLRFLDINGGSITIDDQDIRDITQADLRSAIAYVPQQPLLFHRSIRENIAYGNPKATEAEIFDAATKANATEFIQKLADGFDTMVGERGVKLSGGQRQRIAIARAILKNAPILVLDEATSALDSESERLIQDALETLMQGRTSLVIAHRLSTISSLDRIIVLESGKIIEDGSHSDLIAKKRGTYAKLWKHQSGGFMEE